MTIKPLLFCLLCLLPAIAVQAQPEPCDPPLVASISVSGPVCAGEAVTVTFSLPSDDDGEGFDVTYSVGGNTVSLLNIVNGHTESLIVNAPLSVSLLLVEDNDDDDDECFTTFSQTIPVSVSNPALSVSSQVNPACGQNNGSISLAASGGIGPYNYSLNGAPFQAGSTFSGLGPDSYIVTVRDAIGCTAQTGVSLSGANGPALTIVTETDPACGQTNGSITVAASGGAPPYQYSIGGVNYQNSPVFSNLPPGNYQIFVRDAASCTDVVTAALDDPGAGLPGAAISTSALSGCPDAVFTLTGNLPAGTSGRWGADQVQPPAPTNPVWTIGPLPPGTIRIAWTLSAPGCPDYDYDSLAITVLPPPEADDDGVYTVQQGTSAEPDVLSNDVVPAAASVRILKNATQGNAFFNSQNLLVYQPGLDASGADTVVYEVCLDDCPLACDTASVFLLNVRNDDPCVITGDTSNVFTNGLTPNGDGNNDRLVFRVVSVEDCEINYARSEIIIYNRWGDIVFQASPYNNDWEGKNSDERELPPGVYYFVLRVTLDKVYTQFGSVILIR